MMEKIKSIASDSLIVFLINNFTNNIFLRNFGSIAGNVPPLAAVAYLITAHTNIDKSLYNHQTNSKKDQA